MTSASAASAAPGSGGRPSSEATPTEPGHRGRRGAATASGPRPARCRAPWPGPRAGRRVVGSAGWGRGGRRRAPSARPARWRCARLRAWPSARIEQRTVGHGRPSTARALEQRLRPLLHRRPEPLSPLPPSRSARQRRSGVGWPTKLPSAVRIERRQHTHCGARSSSVGSGRSPRARRAGRACRRDAELATSKAVAERSLTPVVPARPRGRGYGPRSGSQPAIG